MTDEESNDSRIDRTIFVQVFHVRQELEDRSVGDELIPVISMFFPEGTPLFTEPVALVFADPLQLTKNEEAARFISRSILAGSISEAVSFIGHSVGYGFIIEIDEQRCATDIPFIDIRDEVAIINTSQIDAVQAYKFLTSPPSRFRTIASHVADGIIESLLEICESQDLSGENIVECSSV